MTDILGQALQKIASPEISITAQLPQASVPAASSELSLPDEASLIEPAVIEQSPPDTSTTTPEPRPAPSDVSAVTRANALRYLHSHRRQAAAIVVAVCIAVFWLDGGSSSVAVNSADADSARADAAEEELMLDEFDAIEVSPLREPAEPSDMAAADPFPLTIPQMESGAAQTQVSSRGSEHPLLDERIGDVRNQSAVQAESNGSLEFPSQPSSDNSPPAIPRSVRFTGRIQPLN